MLALRKIAIAFAFTLALSSGAPRSMTLAEAPLETLMEEAELVVHGSILQRIVEPVPGHPSALRTRYTLWAWEHLKAPTRKGAPMLITPELLTFVQPGGKGERVTTHVPGVVSLDEGDEVIVLLASTPWGLQPLGYPMGIFFVSPSGQVQGAWPGHSPGSIRALRGTSTFLPEGVKKSSGTIAR